MRVYCHVEQAQPLLRRWGDQLPFTGRVSFLQRLLDGLGKRDRVFQFSFEDGLKNGVDLSEFLGRRQIPVPPFPPAGISWKRRGYPSGCEGHCQFRGDWSTTREDFFSKGGGRL